jgi:hypothetical protein
MTILRNILTQIAREIAPAYRGELVIETDHPGDSHYGYFTEVDYLREKIVPSSGWFRRLRTRKNVLIWVVEEHNEPCTINMRAHDQATFDAAKRHYGSIVEAIAKDKRFAHLADKFSITFKDSNFQPLERTA